MPLSGNLRQHPLPDVLRVIEVNRLTGVLVVLHDKQAEIYFGQGQWLLGDRVGASFPIARQLARLGYLPPEQIESVLRVPFAQVGSIPDVQAVQALLRAGFLSQDHLRAFLLDDAVSLLGTLLSWPDGDFAFQDGTPPPPERVSLPLPVGAVVARALHAGGQPAPASQPMLGQSPRGREAASLGPEAVLTFSDVDPASPIPIQLQREEWKLLASVNGRAPLWAIARELSDLPENQVVGIASALLARGILVISSYAAPSAEAF
ncbi:MAG: hypothetical protein OJF49_002186 [Ktedonobacterales bacterium]|jgi:hypothetical protein|nr:MAG: hypothetical protein OJF49_002186 [Ktedonobacterales bacterium]